MGWTSYHAKYYKNGKVDREKECISNFDSENYDVIKSKMVGSTFYAAIKYKKTEEIFGAVVLTSIDNKDYFNFSYKDMDDTMGPCYYDCPESILKLLTPTEDKWANEWREKCHEHNEWKKTHNLAKLPIGTVIEARWGDTTARLIKRAPAYQFRNPFWYKPDNNTYVPTRRIKDFEIIEEGN